MADGFSSAPMQKSRSLSPRVPPRPVPEAFQVATMQQRPPCFREETIRGQRLFEIETLLRGKSLGELNMFNEQLRE